MSDRTAGRPVRRPSEAAASPVRGKLVELLRASDSPLDAHQLAAATGLHVTTVRFHLDVLAGAGLVVQQRQKRSSAGRPRTVYTAVGGGDVDGYRMLAAVLAANLGATPGVRARRAEKAGMQWAAELAPAQEPTVPDPRVTDEEVARRVTSLFEDLQFEPELRERDENTGEQEIWLRACPYRNVALAHPEVVCSLHLGLLSGVLARLGGRPTTARLVPFVEPELCLAVLIPAAPPGR